MKTQENGINELKRKPRRTRGTPSFYYRNYFALGTILVGSAIFGLWYMTPIFQVGCAKMLRDLRQVEAHKERKYFFNFNPAAHSSDAIKKIMDQAEDLRKTF